LTGLWGFAGLPDSAMKFQQVIAILTQLRNLVKVEMFEDDSDMYFTLLYGKAAGPHAAALKSHFDSVAKNYKETDPDASLEARKSLHAKLGKEIAHWKQLQALYAAEHLKADPLQEDAELLLPPQELEEIISYETHLENQIERKLRQFYARRREPLLRKTETLPAAGAEPEPGELACQAASVEA
jgi:hypothetical protein